MAEQRFQVLTMNVQEIAEFCVRWSSKGSLVTAVCRQDGEWEMICQSADITRIEEAGKQRWGKAAFKRYCSERNKQR